MGHISEITETSQKFENENDHQNDTGRQFRVEKNDSGHKNSFLKVKLIFRG